jgi:hypothetical protein
MKGESRTEKEVDAPNCKGVLFLVLCYGNLCTFGELPRSLAHTRSEESNSRFIANAPFARRALDCALINFPCHGISARQMPTWRWALQILAAGAFKRIGHLQHAIFSECRAINL